MHTWQEGRNIAFSTQAGSMTRRNAVSAVGAGLTLTAPTQQFQTLAHVRGGFLSPWRTRAARPLRHCI